MTTSGVPLQRVRLGHRARALLLAAPPPGSFARAGTVSGGMPVRGHNLGRVAGEPAALWITEDARAARVAALRAAKRLEDLGLVEYRNQLRGERFAYIALTDLGAAVVDRYRHELSTGGRIRWDAEGVGSGSGSVSRPGSAALDTETGNKAFAAELLDRPNPA